MGANEAVLTAHLSQIAKESAMAFSASAADLL